jgi:hypothetical protein
MSSRDDADSRERALRQIRRVTVATGALAVGATVLIGGITALDSGHHTPSPVAPTASATSATAPGASSTTTAPGYGATSTDDTPSSGSTQTGVTPSAETPVAVSGGS